MLMLQLTDGAVEVQGMEYQLIPALNPSLTPGTKVTLLKIIIITIIIISTVCVSATTAA